LTTEKNEDDVNWRELTWEPFVPGPEFAWLSVHIISNESISNQTTGDCGWIRLESNRRWAREEGAREKEEEEEEGKRKDVPYSITQVQYA
jgi:hypothetical protein